MVEPFGHGCFPALSDLRIGSKRIPGGEKNKTYTEAMIGMLKELKI